MRIRTRVLALAGSLAIAGSLISYASVPATAAGPAPRNNANDVVVCDSITGTMSFSPPLLGDGTSPTTTKFKAVLSGCHDTTSGDYDPIDTPNGTTILNGAMSGTLNGTTNLCTVLAGTSSQTGTLIVKWKTLSGTPKLTVPTSTISVSQMFGAISDPIESWAASYGEFLIGTPDTTQLTVTGGFTGGNSGHTSHFDSTTGESVDSLGTSCVLPGAGGIKKAAFGVGTVTLA